MAHPGDLAERLADIRARIEAAAGRAERDPAGVEVVAVTKGQPLTAVRAALAAGLVDVGESRAQELVAKAGDLGETAERAPVWHFVGRIQRNKLKRLAPLVTVWHSLDRPEVAETLADHAAGARVFVQVNVGDEPQKGGCAPEETIGLVERARAVGLAVEGLMGVPPLGDDPRPHFARLRRLAGEAGVSGLSMGMSDDFEIAVEEGASIVRLGRVLFGPRSPVQDLRR